MAVRQYYGKRSRDLELEGSADGQPQRMDGVLNTKMRELCGVKKRVEERIDRCFPVVRPCGKDGD